MHSAPGHSVHHRVLRGTAQVVSVTIHLPADLWHTVQVLAKEEGDTNTVILRALQCGTNAGRSIFSLRSDGNEEHPMLLKAPDDKKVPLAELERLAKIVPFPRKRQIVEEVRILRAGIKGEQESSYLLDFHFKASRNTAIIHDLRLKVNGRVAQIDHLLLHRTLNIFVLETKHFKSGLKITEEGEFLRWNAYEKAYEGMPSPLAQNERHVAVLRDAFEQIDMPTRLGKRLTPVFLSYVLVSPRARIERPKRFDTSHVLKADMLSVEDELNKRGLLKGAGGIMRIVESAKRHGIRQGAFCMM